MVGNGHLSIPQARVFQIQNYSKPSTKSQLRSFLGLCNFYSKFIPNFSSFSSVLTSHLHKKSPDKIPWNNDLTRAFSSIVNAISDHASLVIPTCNEAWCVFSDASLCGVGGVLCVCRNNVWTPCSFFSRQLIPREQKFSATELEALALLETIEHFKFYLSGRSFTAYTDHQALTSIINGVPPSARLTRWKLKLSEYDFSIVYVKGKNNPVADALSRQDWSSSQQHPPQQPEQLPLQLPQQQSSIPEPLPLPQQQPELTVSSSLESSPGDTHPFGEGGRCGGVTTPPHS